MEPLDYTQQRDERREASYGNRYRKHFSIRLHIQSRGGQRLSASFACSSPNARRVMRRIGTHGG